MEPAVRQYNDLTIKILCWKQSVQKKKNWMRKYLTAQK